MEHPIQNLCGHLLFSRDGTVWATWRLQGQAYGRRAVAEKEQIRVLHQMLYRSLGGESLHMGFEVDTDPVQVIRDMLRGLNHPLEELPEWAAEVEATTERLETDLPLSERTYWLSVPLRNSGASRLSEPLRAGTTSLLNKLGAPRGVPATAVLADRLQQAAEIQALIPGPFNARPASAAETVWLYRHAQTRGLAQHTTWLPPAPSTEDLKAAADMTEHELAAVQHMASPGRIGRLILDEAAVSDVAVDGWQKGFRARLRRLLPSQRKVLKIVDTDDDTVVSYQSLAVLAGTPSAGAVFPGTEWLGKAEDSGVPVDWAVRMRNTAREEVLSRNQRAVKNLNDQYMQREGEISTGSHELDTVAAALTEYQALLAKDKLEVELQTITFFATSAGTREEALANGATLARFYSAFDHPLERPLGEQQDAWWAMLPGTSWPKKFNDLTQISLSEGFSAAVPNVSSALGDGRGALWAVNETTLATSAVMVDLFATILANFSAAVAVAGELGSGKSYALKSLAGALVDRGARLVSIDRSSTAEYVSFGRSLGSCTVAAVLDNPDAGVQLEWSLDPLRMFPGDQGSRLAQRLLTPLLSIVPDSDVELALTHTTDPAYRAKHAIDSLQTLTEHLLDPARHDLPGANELGRKLRGLRTKSYARVLFDQTLPALDLWSSRALIFTTHGLQLPTRAELLNEHLFARMDPEKHFGRAMYALLMSLARAVAFADPDELVFFVCDECHHITASIEGEQELEIFVREGRKVGAAAGLGSQDCENDFGSPTLRGLIPYRLVMRLTDENLARKALEWIGLEPTQEHLDEITGDLSPRDPADPDGKVAPERRGEGIFRDSYRRIGRVRILGPALEARRIAYSTTPRPASSKLVKQPSTSPSTAAASRPTARNDATRPATFAPETGTRTGRATPRTTPRTTTPRTTGPRATPPSSTSPSSTSRSTSPATPTRRPRRTNTAGTATASTTAAAVLDKPTHERSRKQIADTTAAAILETPGTAGAALPAPVAAAASAPGAALPPSRRKKTSPRPDPVATNTSQQTHDQDNSQDEDQG